MRTSRAHWFNRSPAERAFVKEVDGQCPCDIVGARAVGLVRRDSLCVLPMPSGPVIFSRMRRRPNRVEGPIGTGCSHRIATYGDLMTRDAA